MPETTSAPWYENDTETSMHKRMAAFIRDLQKEITGALEALDGKKFFFDHWENGATRQGCSAVLQEGNVFEKAGVNVSVMTGCPVSAVMLQNMRDRITGLTADAKYNFNVAGISLVIHPRNPHAPTSHANYRYFEITRADSDDATPVSWWFGGGADLTPSYLVEEDARHFHAVLKAPCDKADPNFYAKFKQWADKYFWLECRGEARGIGGTFFDDLNCKPAEDLFRFVRDSGHAYVPAYVPIVARRKDAPFTDAEKEWQQLRRGRYVEFNLIYDRGTKFGLASSGGPGSERILMTLPLTARWEYKHEPADDSPEARMMQVLRNPVDWA